jgi:hypothetical protein
MTRACGYDGIDCETVLPFGSVELVIGGLGRSIKRAPAHKYWHLRTHA